MIESANRVVVSLMAHDLRGNKILDIAKEVAQMKAEGQVVGNLTMGDFDPNEFPIPETLRELIIEQLREGQTNYPPPTGVAELRQSVANAYASELGLDYSAENILVASGTRPLIYAAYQTIVDPGDTVIYGAPSWNNDHYCHLTGAIAADIPTRPENNFMPTLADIEPYLDRAVLIALNSPMNPSGTLMPAEALRPIGERVLEVNERRLKRGAKPVYILYDQVYHRLTYDREHIHPVGLLPELKDFTIYTDGASKNLAGTGLRVGWAAVPEHILGPMAKIVTHMGAWAPKSEQIAIARYLPMEEDRYAFLRNMQGKFRDRLNRLFSTLDELRQEGWPVMAFRPQGGLFLSCYFGISGYETPEGSLLRSTKDVRQYLLHTGRAAVVPFDAFGDKENTEWFRASVSGITEPDFAYCLNELSAAIRKLRIPQ